MPPDLSSMRFDTMDALREGPVRFAIGDPSGLTSNSWRIWTSKSGDVYIACRDNYREVKVSLHPSGRWRFGFTGEAVGGRSELVSPDEDRAWEVWDKPHMREGVVPAFQLFFLPEELAVWPSQRPPRSWAKVIVVAPPPPGAVSIATVWITEERLPITFAIGPMVTLAVLPLADGRYVQVTVHLEEPSEAWREHLERQFVEGLSRAQDAGIVIPPDGRLVLFGNSSEGTRFLVEFRAHRSPPASEFHPDPELGPAPPAHGVAPVRNQLPGGFD